MLVAIGCAGPPARTDRTIVPPPAAQQEVFTPPKLHLEPGLQRVWQNGPTEAQAARWRSRLAPQGHSEQTHQNNGAPVFLDDSESVVPGHE